MGIGHNGPSEISSDQVTYGSHTSRPIVPNQGTSGVRVCVLACLRAREMVRHPPWPYSSPMPPIVRVTPAPRLILNGRPSPELGRDLVSLCVHAVEGKAAAEVVLAGHSQADLPSGTGIFEAELKIQLAADDECFSGQITAVEGRMPPGTSPQTVLFAAGASPDGSVRSIIPLHFGAELDSASVRREAGGSTARCVSSALGLRCNSRVELSTQNPTLDGRFQIVEIWYRVDSSTGVKVEFIAAG